MLSAKWQFTHIDQNTSFSLSQTTEKFIYSNTLLANCLQFHQHSVFSNNDSIRTRYKQLA